MMFSAVLCLGRLLQPKPLDMTPTRHPKVNPSQVDVLLHSK